MVIGGVNNINGRAFAKCEELKDVYYLSHNVPSVDSDAFEDSYVGFANLHVLATMVDAFKAADTWKDFGNIIGITGKEANLPFQTYTLTVNHPSDCQVYINGTDYPSFGSTITKGQNLRLSVSLYSMAYISSIKVNGSERIDDYNLYGYVDINNVNSDITVDIEYGPEYHVAVNNYAGAMGGGSVQDNYGNSCDSWVQNYFVYMLEEGTSYSLTITPDPGMTVSNFMVNGSDEKSSLVKNGNDYVYTTTINGDLTIDVYFVEYFTLTVNYNSGGTLTDKEYGTTIANGTTLEKYSDHADIYIEAQAGCEILSILHNGTEVGTVGSYGSNYSCYIGSGEGSNQTLDVTFRLTQSFVYVNSQGNGTVQVQNEVVGNGESRAFDPYQNIALTFTPASGWMVGSADINGTDITADAQNGSHTIQDIDASKTLTVTFVPATLTFNHPYMTICSPRGLDFTNNADVTAWTVVGFKDGRAQLSRIDILPAGKAALLQAAVGTTCTLTYTDEKFYMASLMVGLLNKTWVDSYSDNAAGEYCHNYIFTNGSKGYGFYPIDPSGDLEAGKAYLPIPADIAGARAHFGLDFDGETSGITSVEQTGEQRAVYTLSGMRVEKARKGMYISNGKKVVIK